MSGVAADEQTWREDSPKGMTWQRVLELMLAVRGGDPVHREHTLRALAEEPEESFAAAGQAFVLRERVPMEEVVDGRARLELWRSRALRIRSLIACCAGVWRDLVNMKSENGRQMAVRLGTALENAQDAFLWPAAPEAMAVEAAFTNLAEVAAKVDPLQSAWADQIIAAMSAIGDFLFREETKSQGEEQ